MNRWCSLLLLILCPFCMGKSNRVLLNDLPELELNVIEPWFVRNTSCHDRQGIQLVTESPVSVPLHTQLTSSPGGPVNHVLEPVSEVLQTAGWQQHFLWWLPLSADENCTMTVDLYIDSPGPVQALVFQGEYDEPPCHPLSEGFRCIISRDYPQLSFLLSKQDSLYDIKQVAGTPANNCPRSRYDWLLAGRVGMLWQEPVLKHNQQVIQIFPLQNHNKYDENPGSGEGHSGAGEEEEQEPDNAANTLTLPAPAPVCPPIHSLMPSLNFPSFFEPPAMPFSFDDGGLFTAPLGGSASYSPLWNHFWLTHGPGINNWISSLYQAFLRNLAFGGFQPPAPPLPVNMAGAPPVFSSCSAQHQHMQSETPSLDMQYDGSTAVMVQDSEAKPKKNRITFKTSQLEEMERVFEGKKYLTPSEISELAGKLNLSERRVRTWFQNRRTKFKGENSEMQIVRSLKLVEVRVNDKEATEAVAEGASASIRGKSKNTGTSSKEKTESQDVDSDLEEQYHRSRKRRRHH